MLSWWKNHVWVTTKIYPSVREVLNRKDLVFQPLEILRFESSNLCPLVRVTGHNCDPSHQFGLSRKPSSNSKVLRDQHGNPLQTKAQNQSPITKGLQLSVLGSGQLAFHIGQHSIAPVEDGASKAVNCHPHLESGGYM